MARGQAARITTEKRVAEIASEIMNGLTTDEIVRKYTQVYKLSRRMVDNYIARASAIIRERTEQTHGTALQRSIDMLVQATPKAIQTLELALNGKDKEGIPSSNAIRAAAEIIHKALPENIRLENVQPELSDDEIEARFKEIIRRVTIKTRKT